MANEQLQLQFEIRPTALLGVDELYSQADQSLLERLREDVRSERKPAGTHADALGVYFSAFANTKPDGGLIVVGIDDNGTISGCLRASQTHINGLERAGYTFCPDARYECRRVPVFRQDGQPDFVLLFRVFYHPARVIETVKGEAYIRRSDQKSKLTDAQKRELQNEKGQIEVEREPCRELTYPDDFDEGLIARFADAFRRTRSLSPGPSNNEVLAMRHMGEVKAGCFVPNIACALLFAKDPCSALPGCKIRFLRFDGEIEGSGERFNAVKDIWIEGNIPKLIVDTEQVLESQLRTFSKLGPDGKFYTVPEYPKAAWYEAIVNACVHRSYGLRNMNIFVRMFDDRLVIESPGGFPGLVTPDNIYDVHHPRNPYLMEAMYHLDFVKCAHEGTRRMRDTMAESRLPEPEFSQKDISHALVQVTLRNNVKQRKVWIDSDASTLVGEAIFSTLAEHERRFINFVAEHESINVSQAARLVGYGWHTAKKRLEALAGRGILERIGKPGADRDCKAHYVLARTTAKPR